MLRRRPARYRPVSLRLQLIVGVLSLTAVALVGSGLFTYVQLRSFLTHRLDSSLVVTQRGIRAAVRSALLTNALPADQDMVNAAVERSVRSQLPPGGVAALFRPGRPLLLLGVGDYRHTPVSSVALPPEVATTAAQVAADRSTEPLHPEPVEFTNRLLPRGAYRLATAPLTLDPATAGDAVVVGFPRRDTVATLHRLLLVEGVVTATALSALAALGLLVIRGALRPLRTVITTADAIAAGDLTRRVPVPASSTEVGRLAGALNRMLAENEAAFTARTASEARLRRFLADAGHELRTPLASVRGYAELLVAGRLTAGQAAISAERIESEATRMTRMVDDLMLLTRLDQHRPLAEAPVDLAALIRGAVADLRVVDPSRPVTLDVPAALWWTGDPDRLRQVLDNLLSNTRVHTPSGSAVHVSLTGGAEDPPAVIEVVDHGPGMSAEVAANAFLPFFQGDPSGRDNGGGSGLGLAIVNAIVDAHGGRISLETTPGSGCRFTVTLPGPPARPPAA